MANREYKFRAWDTKENCWHNAWSIHSSGYWKNDDYGWREVPDNIKIMQYTGLKDENGKEVYEGDIVKCHHFWEGDKEHFLYHEIVWSEEYHAWKTLSVGAKDENDGSPLLFVYTDRGKKEFEVVGNIYENPELLELKETQTKEGV